MSDQDDVGRRLDKFRPWTASRLQETPTAVLRVLLSEMQDCGRLARENDKHGSAAGFELSAVLLCEYLATRA